MSGKTEKMPASYFAAGIILFIGCFGCAVTYAQQAPQGQSSAGQADKSNSTKTNTGPATAPEESPLEKAKDLYRTGRLDEAEQQYEGLIRDEPRSVLGYIGLAQTLLREQRVSEAYGAASKAVELAPTFDGAHEALGEVYFRQGRMAEAEKEFTPLVKAGTREARAYMGLGQIYWAASFYKHGKAAFDQAYALDPADPDIRREWAMTLPLKEQLKGLESFLSSSGSDSDHPDPDLIMALKGQEARAKRPCRLASKPVAVETKLVPLLYDATQIRAFALQVKLNDTPSKLELDTGASGILLTSKVAERAGVKRITGTKIGGIGEKGDAGGYIGYVDSVKLGEVEFQDC